MNLYSPRSTRRTQRERKESIQIFLRVLCALRGEKYLRFAENPFRLHRALVCLVHVVSAMARQDIGGGGGGAFHGDDRFAFFEMLLVIPRFVFGDSQTD